MLEQLSLFGFEEEVKEAVVPPQPEAPKASGQGDVVFSDDKISVKIKLKQPVESVINNEVAEEKQIITSPLLITRTRRKKVPGIPQKRGRKSFKEIDAEIDLVEVPDDEVLFQKQYYPISIVAGWFNVNASLLRYWENEFDALKPRKNRKGDRLFRPEDVKTLQTIYYLLRQQKFTIEGAKEYLKVHKKNLDVQVELTQSLNRFRSFLLELKANL